MSAISTETAMRQVDERLSYFRQLALILGAVSLAVGFLLVTTLVTVSVNERLGEIVVMRAIGVARSRIVQQIVLEGSAIMIVGALAGLGSGSSRRAISTRFSRRSRGFRRRSTSSSSSRATRGRRSGCSSAPGFSPACIRRGAAHRGRSRRRCAKRPSDERTPAGRAARSASRIPHGRRARSRGARRDARRRARRLRGDRRPVGLRQVDAAQSDRRHRSSERGHGDDRRRARRRDARLARRRAFGSSTSGSCSSASI